jgi:hypothetical protein
MSLSEIKNDGVVVCAHFACHCPVGEGEQYCSESCRLAKREDVDCFCKHDTCDMKDDEP